MLRIYTNGLLLTLPLVEKNFEEFNTRLDAYIARGLGDMMIPGNGLKCDDYGTVTGVMNNRAKGQAITFRELRQSIGALEGFIDMYEPDIEEMQVFVENLTRGDEEGVAFIGVQDGPRASKTDQGLTNVS